MDLENLQILKDYEEIQLSSVAWRALHRYFLYLSEELASLAISDDGVPLEMKRKMDELLQK